MKFTSVFEKKNKFQINNKKQLKIKLIWGNKKKKSINGTICKLKFILKNTIKKN